MRLPTFLIAAGGGLMVALAATVLLFVTLAAGGDVRGERGLADAEEMVVAAVVPGPDHGDEVVVLRALEGEALVPVPVSPAEGARIRDVEGSVSGDPSLLEEAVAAFGGTIEAAVLDGSGGGFALTGRLLVDRDGARMELPASPAEAIAAAVESGRPIFTTRRAMEASALTGEDLARIHEGLPGTGPGPSVSM